MVKMTTEIAKQSSYINQFCVSKFCEIPNNIVNNNVYNINIGDCHLLEVDKITIAAKIGVNVAKWTSCIIQFV